MELTPIERLALTILDEHIPTLCKKLGLDEHPMFPRAVWLAVVNAGQTDEGYWAWACVMHERTQKEPRETRRPGPAPVRLTPTMVHVPQTPVTTIDLAQLVQNWSQGDTNES